MLEMVLPPMFGKEKLMALGCHQIAPTSNEVLFFYASVSSVSSPERCNRTPNTSREKVKV